MRCAKGIVSALALIVGLTLVATVDAGQSGTGARKTGKKIKQVQDNVLVAQLQIAYRVVEKADPIYKGHRVKAMKQIKEAIGQLQKEMKRRGLKPVRQKHGIDEPKSVSDADLNEGIKVLKSVQSQLKGLQGTVHRNKAANHIANAIKQLKTALAVTKRQDG